MLVRAYERSCAIGYMYSVMYRAIVRTKYTIFSVYTRINVRVHFKNRYG